MKMSIEWHRDCLTNWKKSLQREEAEMGRLIERVERTRSQLTFYEKQIKDAVDKRKDGFDSDKFGGKVAVTANVKLCGERSESRSHAKLGDNEKG